ncbi:MAG: hypothetical protein CSA62_12815 [Planctomycetota bacterium]|nr:MAG: hypothetical protein CSA62_12815 [Planctomycetota bacterium]
MKAASLLPTCLPKGAEPSFRRRPFFVGIGLWLVLREKSGFAGNQSALSVTESMAALGSEVSKQGG